VFTKKQNRKDEVIMKFNSGNAIVRVVLSLVVLCGSSVFAAGTGEHSFNAYHSPDEVNRVLQGMATSNPGIAKLHSLAVTPGKKAVMVLEIGPEVGKAKKDLPAVFVAANLNGTVPVAAEAGLYLAQLLLKQPGERKDKTWYILPMGNPDAAWRFFQKPLRKDPRNNRPHNDDMDDRTDEDGVEDLDGNGIITRMRVKDPKGQWLPLEGEPRLMKKADWTKGEQGIYTLYSEGTDNDGDGQYNEDGPGGVDISINFPHLFKFHGRTGGAWAGSEDETYQLFKFIYQHPEIAMTLCFGDTNFCKVPPRGGRKGTADFSKIKISPPIAKRFGFDPDKTYSMKQIMERAKQLVPPGMELTENMVASFLGLGAAVNPQPADLKFYTAISEEYKEFLKKHKLDAKRLEPAAARDGSFELWAYYHLGVPSFSLDFWTLPQVETKKKGPAITPDKLESMSKEEFLALGEEKIAALLKSSGAPANIKAEMVINMVKNGMMTTKRMAAMMRQMPKPKSKEGADPNEKALLAFSDKELKGKGYVQWKPYSHPTLGEVEIGGFVPFADNTPPPTLMEGLLKGQVPWTFELVKKLPRIDIANTRVDSLGGGLYRVKVWVRNTGLIPYPTAMGKRNNRITPVVVTLEGKNFKILEGKPRSLVKSIGGHSAQTVEWVLHAPQAVKLQVRAYTPSAWSDTAQLALGPGGSK
jgi:hypothetical protein